MSREDRGHWKDIASLWKHVGPPLRPSASDLQYFHQAIVERQGEVEGDLDGLILGVTPEFSGKIWPNSNLVHAVDRSRPMVHHCWVGVPGNVILGEWLHLPLGSLTKDVVLLDGGLAFFEYPEKLRELFSEIGRVLRSGGRMVLRPFTPPKLRETSSNVGDALRGKKISNFNEFKFRLWMALRGDERVTVCPRDVYEWVFEYSKGDLENFAREQDWDIDHVLALCSHKESSVVYHFPSVEEIEALACDDLSCFEHHVTHSGREEDGSCPVMVFRKN